MKALVYHGPGQKALDERPKPVLRDAGDAIVHIFKPDVRQFYNLEKMWSADRPADARSARSS